MLVPGYQSGEGGSWPVCTLYLSVIVTGSGGGDVLDVSIDCKSGQKSPAAVASATSIEIRIRFMLEC